MQEVELKPFSEYRFEVNTEQELKVYVVEGNCEILGQELLNERWYSFKSTKGYLYTLKGCRMKIEGEPDLQYVSSDSNIRSIVDL